MNGRLANGKFVLGSSSIQRYKWKPTYLIAEVQAKAAHDAEVQQDRAPAKVLSKPTNPLDRSDTRIALVVGNAAYQFVARLRNTVNDANAVAEALRSVGFQRVTILTDITREQLVDALKRFADEAASADWAVVYFAGHGIEMNGPNYLIPVDAKLVNDRDVQYESIPLDQVLGATEGARKLHLVILDACRNNPFLTTIARSVASRSIEREFAAVEPQGGTLVVYAAKEHATSEDGSGEHSPFATALMKELVKPGVEVRRVFDLVRDDVKDLTDGRQQPFTYGSLSGREDFYFVEK